MLELEPQASFCKTISSVTSARQPDLINVYPYHYYYYYYNYSSHPFVCYVLL